jgi:Calcineurin-like phosphoesterase
MIAVVGDIHGCYNTLKQIIAKIKEKYSGIQIYSVGDLVDRGNFSCKVIDLIISEQIKFTPGNHDYMFYYFIKQPESEMARAWVYNGFENTITSYDDKLDKAEQHLTLIAKAPLFFNLDDCFISHAGISLYYKSELPDDYLNNYEKLDAFLRSNVSDEHGVLWTRDELLNIGKLQIVGHTRKEEVTYQKSNNVAYIDTSIYTGNKLSAVIVDNNEIIDTISVPTVLSDIE